MDESDDITGWLAWADHLDAQRRPFQDWMIDRLELGPGDVALELACGTGGIGLALRRRLGPGCRVICSDVSEAMVTATRQRMLGAGESDVEVRRIDAEQIPLPDQSVDGVVCELGFMLMDDPVAALSESWRVLRPGRRLALSVWADRDLNPWRVILEEALGRPVSARAAEARGPGVFTLSDAGRLRSLLAGAGFATIEVESISAPHRHASAADWWTTELALSEERRTEFERQDPLSHEQIRAHALRQIEEFRESDDLPAVAVPAAMLVAVATRP